jgi:predicted alpha-1,2-mannosidase
MGDYGHFTIMANTGSEVHTSCFRRSRSYRGEFHPHHFRAELLNDGTVIEVAPSLRGAIFAFAFAGEHGRVIFEPCAGESSFKVVDSRTISGWVNGNSGGVPEGFAHYFVATFDRDFRSVSAFQGDSRVDQQAGERVGFVAEFDGNVTLRLATSFISVEQAAVNLANEVVGRSFDTIRGEAEAEWEATLGRIDIESDEPDTLRTFYSCLYRTQLFPRVWHEETASGIRHRSPFDGGIHDGVLYTDNGFWDTYRTVYPLFGLLQPDRLADILQGWTNAYREGGWFPQWASPGYRACMVGTHIDAVMADGAARGITNFDLPTAIEGMIKHTHTVGDPNGAWGRIGVEDYLRLGYVSTDHHESVARSLDYAYDDWCIGQLVPNWPGKARAQNYRFLYDPEVGFMRAKLPDGTWKAPWDPYKWGDPYVEGGPWQSSWAAPHDAAGLIRLMGGESKFVAKLDEFLGTPPYFTTGAYGFEIHEMTEMAQANFGQYAHSNQPVHHVLYLYNTAGRPWRTQREVRRVLDGLYSPTHLPGDEDNGEMSAWYVLSALGIYPLTPGHPSWTLGSPRFPRATVHLPNGSDFVIEAEGNSRDHVYVSEVRLNGELLDRLALSHDEVAKGGTLRFTMSDQPKEVIVPPSGRPFSDTPYDAD